MKPSLAAFGIGSLDNFVKRFFEGMGRQRLKTLVELMRGVLQGKKLQVVNAARTSCRSGAAPMEIWGRSKRFYRLLESAEWSLEDGAEQYRAYAAQKIDPEELIVVDLGDVQKPASKKMPFLEYVHDGSEDEIGRGYWLFESCLVKSRRDILPLHNFLYSLGDPDTPSENLVIQRGLQTILDSTQGNGLFVMDRGFDRKELYRWMDERNARYLVRLRGDRKLEDRSGEDLGIAQDFAATMPLPHVIKLESQRTGKERLLPFGFQAVRLPGEKRPLSLIALSAPDEDEPFLLLLTTVEVTNHFQAEKVIRNYFLRWAVETLTQFVKQETGLEDFRVRNFDAIRRLIWIGYFISAWLQLLLERGEKYVRAIVERAGCVPTRPEPDFLYYRLVWGLRAIALASAARGSG